MALALGSVRLVWRGLTFEMLDFRFVLMFIIERFETHPVAAN